MKVAVIGAGRMGGWFCKYFRSKGHEVLVYDTKPEAARRLSRATGCRICKDIKETLESSDLSLIAVPMDVMPDVVVDAIKYARPGTAIVEISSIKHKVVSLMKRKSKRGVITVSMHPLFGHGAKGLQGRTITIIPVKDKIRELKLAKRIFKGAKFVVMDAKLHDRLMAFSLGLSHVIAVALAYTTDRRMMRYLWRASGTTMRLQLLSTATAATDKPEFLLNVFGMNPKAKDALSLYVKNLDRIRRLIERKDSRRLKHVYDECRSKLPRGAYTAAYKLLDSINALLRT